MNQFKGMKKVSEDNNIAVFRHPGGHEIKIAKGGLSSKMKSDLAKLPLYQAEGTKPDDSGVASWTNPGRDLPTDDTSDFQVPISTSLSTGPQQPLDNNPGVASWTTPGKDTPIGTTPDAATPEDKSAGVTVPLDFSSSPTTVTSQAPEAAQTATPEQNKIDYNPYSFLTEPTSAPDAYIQMGDETNKLKADFNNGKITPETYGSLFAKKDTLGKIGTIFGLLLGGIGGGLTHTPSAALQMMQKQIDNDLEAQKATKGNEFNALNLAEKHLMNQSEISLQGKQGEQTEANTGLIRQNTELAKNEYS
jgi:hypothetical protein